MNQPPTPSGNQPLDRFKMETNFEGLIQLLAKSLYPDPDVFVRELIQNGHDSIIRRQTIEPDIQGKIDIKLPKFWPNKRHVAQPQRAESLAK